MSCSNTESPRNAKQVCCQLTREHQKDRFLWTWVTITEMSRTLHIWPISPVHRSKLGLAITNLKYPHRKCSKQESKALALRKSLLNFLSSIQWKTHHLQKVSSKCSTLLTCWSLALTRASSLAELTPQTLLTTRWCWNNRFTWKMTKQVLER